MKYPITYACGCSGRVDLTGRVELREKRLEFLSRGECFDCYKKHSTQSAKKEADELDLPQLVGSENQIAYAETLRITKFAEVEKLVESIEGTEEQKRITLLAFERISNETSAEQWIEWSVSYTSARSILRDTIRVLLAEPTKEQKQEQLVEQKRKEDARRAAQSEATLRPSSPISEMVATLSLQDRCVYAVLPEREERFVQIVHAMGYTWGSGRWERTIDSYAGPPMDRVVELGCVLLAKGFIIRAFDEEMRSRIVAGSFEPEQTRWIKTLIKGEFTGWFAIHWGRNEDYCNAARKLPQSRYCRPYVVVPPAQFEQVIDFAQMYDFRVSSSAKKLSQEAKEDKERQIIVKPMPLKTQEKKKEPASSIPPVLTIPTDIEVDESLRDD